MNRFRSSWENFDTEDPVVRAIAIVALILFLIFAAPYLPLPYIASGVGCYELAQSTSTGSNQSILGSTASSSDMRLELVPNPINLKQGDTLNMDVRFINVSMAPLTLFLPLNQYGFRYDEQEDGLLFEIVGSDNNLRGEGRNARPPLFDPQLYSPNDLHVLAPRQRCTINVSIDPNRLAAANVTPVTYRIIAVYRNTVKGALPPVTQFTPTPIFTDAGVWTGTVQSNEIILNYGVPPGS